MLGLVFHKFGGKGKLINGVQERTGETEGEREREEERTREREREEAQRGRT